MTIHLTIGRALIEDQHNIHKLGDLQEAIRDFENTDRRQMTKTITILQKRNCEDSLNLY